MPDQNHDRFNAAVAAHLPVAMEAQEALSEAVDLTGPYQADVGEGALTIAGRRLQVLLLGTVSKSSNTWLWSWANQGFSPDTPAIAPVRRVAEVAESWGLWELADAQFSLDGIVDTGLGAGASVALVAAPLVGATAFYAADYGQGIAFFAVTDQALPRPTASSVTFPRRVLSAVSVLPGHARSQVLTYAAVHNLRVTGEGEVLTVHLPEGAMHVTFDAQGRVESVSGTMQAPSAP